MAALMLLTALLLGMGIIYPIVMIAILWPVYKLTGGKRDFRDWIKRMDF